VWINWTGESGLAHACKYYALTAIVADTIVACGGNDGKSVLAVCEQYSIANDMWTIYTSLPQPLAGLTIVALGSTAYACGGYTGWSRVRNTYALAVAVWTARADMPLVLAAHTAVAVDNATVLVCGGYNGSAVITLVLPTLCQ
jgi:hypothetical protein